MKLRSIHGYNIHGRDYDVDLTSDVFALAGANEAGKTTALGLVRLALEPPKQGRHPVVGKSTGWTVSLGFDDAVVITRRRTTAGHTLAVIGLGHAGEPQEIVDRFVGRAAPWSVSDFLGLSPAARIAWLDENALSAVPVDPVALVKKGISEGQHRLLWEILEIVWPEPTEEVPEPRPAPPGDEAGYAFLRHARLATSEADKVNERAIKSLRGTVEQLDAEVARLEAPAGTVASWRGRAALVQEAINTNAQRRGEIIGREPHRRELEDRLAILAARADAAAITNTPETLRRKRAKLAGQLEEEKARAVLAPALGRLREVLTTAGESPVQMTAEQRSEVEALLRPADATLVDVGDRALAGIDRELDAATAAAEIETVNLALAELGSGDTVMLDEESATLTHQLDEAVRAADRLNDIAAISATLEERRADLAAALARRTAVRELLKRLTEVWVHSLDVAALSEVASRLTVSAMNQTLDLSIDDSCGLRMSLSEVSAGRRYSAVPLESASESQAAIAAAALDIAVQHRLGGWRHLLLDNAEHFDRDRRANVLAALTRWAAAGELDTAILAFAITLADVGALPADQPVQWLGATT